MQTEASAWSHKSDVVVHTIIHLGGEYRRTRVQVHLQLSNKFDTSLEYIIPCQTKGGERDGKRKRGRKGRREEERHPLRPQQLGNEISAVVMVWCESVIPELNKRILSSKLAWLYSVSKVPRGQGREKGEEERG